jgi:hypothetical protein
VVIASVDLQIVLSVRFKSTLATAKRCLSSGVHALKVDVVFINAPECHHVTLFALVLFEISEVDHFVGTRVSFYVEDKCVTALTVCC